MKFVVSVLLLAGVVAARAEVAVLSQHNDLSHTGANLSEAILNTTNVNTNTFGLLYTRPVDDQVYAQPLVMTNVDVPGKGTHNLVIVATVNDSVYAFDADDGSVTAPYWQVSFISPTDIVAPSHVDMSALGACGGNYNDFLGNMGIVGTPVIDPATGTVYLVARTKEPGNKFVQRLHALDVRTGRERDNSPVIITATYPGNGDGSVDGVITFDPVRQNQRPGLELVNGVVYIAWASHCDMGPYHGWILGYDATSLKQVVAYNDTPNGFDGGIWMSAEGLAADTNGNLYLSVGNGSVGSNGNLRDPLNRGESLLKLTRNGTNLNVASWFTPYDYKKLEDADADFGSSGVILIPGSSLAFTGSKEGWGYLVERDNMGGLSTTNADTNVLQSFMVTPDQVHGSMVWWDSPNGSYGYIWPASVFLQQYTFDRSSNRFVLPVFAQSVASAPDGQPGGILALSANGTNAASGIVWASHQLIGNANQQTQPGILHAFNALNVNQELWNSEQLSSRDSVGNFAKFVAPTVANGKVYLATFSGRLDVYGLASGWVSQPAISPNGGTFLGSQKITLSDATPGASIYYTLNGGTPTAKSILYTGPFEIKDAAVLKVKAVAPGAVDSRVMRATFLNGAALGNGTGLTGEYFSNHVKNFDGPPTLVRQDPTVDFDWGLGSPDPRISVDHFTVRWTGSLQALASDTYTFYTKTDDGLRLWINDKLIVDFWLNEGATEHSGSIDLVGQQRYNIRMEYFEDAGNASATLSWETPSFPKTIIPRTQLYPNATRPPSVAMVAPTNGSTYRASASVTMAASAACGFNVPRWVDFYTNGAFCGSVSNSSSSLSNVMTRTLTGLEAGSYELTAVAWDATGLASTSAPVSIVIAAGSGKPYGLTERMPVAPFLNMPGSLAGPMPKQLSLTGVFADTAQMSPAPGLLPYSIKVPPWSDGAIETRYLSVPYTGQPGAPVEQISFSPTGEWKFPAGTVFVRTFELATNAMNPALTRRLETQLLVRDTNGAAYGVTYKWRADNSDADLLTDSLTEDIPIVTATGRQTQTWYFPSMSDCLVCHTPAANFVLGVKTRQLNGDFTYPSTGQMDNQLRTLNRLGLFNPAIDEAAISGYPRLSALTDRNVPLEERVRSYLDANCAECHRPGGSGPTLDTRYDTPLARQHLVNMPVSCGDLGFANARVVVPKDLNRSILWDRMNTTNITLRMPSLTRTLVDTNAVESVAEWIKSLPEIVSPPRPYRGWRGGVGAESRQPPRQ